MQPPKIVLTDVIDNDSCKLWPLGVWSQCEDGLIVISKKYLQKKPDGKNFEWFVDSVELFLKLDSQCRVVVLTGSASDLGYW